MGLRARFREVYKDESNEIKYTIDSLFYLNIALIFTFIALTIIYVISKSYTKVPIAILIELLYAFSFYLGYKKKYNASSILMTTLVILILYLLTKIVPGNPDMTLTTILLKYFLFVIFLLVFISYSTFQKHRITVHLQSDAKNLFEETIKKSSQMATLLDDVQKSIGITSGLITEVNSIKSKIKETNEKLVDFSNDMDKFRQVFQSRRFNYLELVQN